jgi:hypothetical protein
MRGDITIVGTGGLNVVPTTKCLTEAGATAIYAGEPVKLKSAGSQYVIPLADAEPVIGTTTQFIGIAAQDSGHTATANGYMDVYMYNPAVVYAVKAKSATAADTQAEIDALLGNSILIDLTSSTYTIDTAAGNAATSGLQVVGGDPELGLIYFKVRQAAAQGAIA